MGGRRATPAPCTAPNRWREAQQQSCCAGRGHTLVYSKERLGDDMARKDDVNDLEVCIWLDHMQILLLGCITLQLSLHWHNALGLLGHARTVTHVMTPTVLIGAPNRRSACGRSWTRCSRRTAKSRSTGSRPGRRRRAGSGRGRATHEAVPTFLVLCDTCPMHRTPALKQNQCSVVSLQTRAMCVACVAHSLSTRDAPPL